MHCDGSMLVCASHVQGIGMGVCRLYAVGALPPEASTIFEKRNEILQRLVPSQSQLWRPTSIHTPHSTLEPLHSTAQRLTNDLRIEMIMRGIFVRKHVNQAIDSCGPDFCCAIFIRTGRCGSEERE